MCRNFFFSQKETNFINDTSIMKLQLTVDEASLMRGKVKFFHLNAKLLWFNDAFMII